jgi:Domain of unknown function (DUF4868)
MTCFSLRMEPSMTALTESDDRNELVELVAQPETRVNLTLAWRQSPPRYRIELVDIDDQIGRAFLGYAQAAAADLLERTEIDYDPEWLLRDHEYYALPKDQVPGDNLFPALSDFQNLPTFRKKSLTKPRLYAVAIQTPSGTALFGRRMAYLKVLKQTKSSFAVVWDGSSFNALGDSVATFATIFDWIHWNDVLYVLDGASFHAEFRDVAALQKAVDDHVASIETYVAIQNVALMRERCRANVAMASKLKRVSEHGLHRTSSVADLKGYATKYGIDVEWDGDELVFDGSLKGQWDILKLLDEDRTEGPLSHRHYESAAKREV